MPKAIAGAGHKILEHIIRIQRDGLIRVVKNAAGGQIIAVKADRDESLRNSLSRVGEWLLALTLVVLKGFYVYVWLYPLS